MIDMACPSCGRAGQVPKEKLHTRLVCRKCHVVFHVDGNGRPVLGEPVSKESKDKKEKEKKPVLAGFKLPTLDDFTGAGNDLSEYTFPVKPVAGVVGGLVVLYFIWGFLAGPGQSVADCSKTVAAALAKDDVDELKKFASSDTQNDVVRWYDTAHPQLEKARETWPSKEATVTVMTVEEDRSTGKGETEVFYTPAGAAGAPGTPPPPPPMYKPGDEKSASKSAAPAGPKNCSFHLYWVRSGSHWMLDGRQSHLMAARATSNQ
jgi:hypothetical protein